MHKHKIRKIAVLLMILIVLFGSLSFAESTSNDDGGFLGKKLQELLKWAPNTIGDGLNEIGPAAEDIYMPGSPYYYKFATNNIFGLFTSKAYPLFKLIAIIMISPLLSFYGVGLIKASSGIGRKTAIDAITVLVISVGILWFLPEILNFIFNMKDNIANGINQMFVTGDNAGFVEEMRQISAEGGVMDALLYLASVVFSYWLMANYVGMSFGFSVLLLYTPIALVISSAKNMRKTASELNKTLWGYVLTPLFDISILGIVTMTRGIDPSTFGIEPLMYNIITVVLVMSVIPLRSGIKKLFGFGPMLGDMLGVGMMAAVAGMALRGAGKGKSKYSGGNGYQEHDEDDSVNQNQERASYYSDLAAMDRQKQDPGTAVGMYNPANADLPPLKEMSREEFLDKHQGKSYFNDRDIGGLSNQEKADYYEKQSKLDDIQAVQDRQERIKSFRKDAGLKALKTGVKVYTAGVGASAGMFMGPAGAAALGMAGYKLGDKLTNSGDTIRKIQAHRKDLAEEEGYRDVSSKFNFVNSDSSKRFEDIANEVNSESISDAIKVEAMNMEDESGANLSRTSSGYKYEVQVDEIANESMNRSNNNVSNVMKSVVDQYSKEAYANYYRQASNATNPKNITEHAEELRIQISKYENGANSIVSQFKDANTTITRDLKFNIKEDFHKNGEVADAEFNQKEDYKASVARYEAYENIVKEVSEKVGIDFADHIRNVNTM